MKRYINVIASVEIMVEFENGTPKINEFNELLRDTIKRGNWFNVSPDIRVIAESFE